MSTAWKIVITVVASLIVAGGGTYYYMNQKLESEKSDLWNQITELNKQIEDLQTTATPATDSDSDTATEDTADETAGWKTYTNSIYKFSFKYPETLKTIDDQIPATVSFDNSPSKNLEISSDDKTIQVWANPGGFSLEGAFDSYRGEIVNGKIVVSSKQHNDDGATYNNKAQVVLGLLQQGDFSYMVAFLYPPDDRTTSLAEFDQILSTFKFNN